MGKASRNLEFERAATYRDEINSINQSMSLQQVVDFHSSSTDYIGLSSIDDVISFIILQFRGGKMIGKEVYNSEIYSSEEEVLEQFIIQYYSKVHFIPKAIYLPLEINIENLFNSSPVVNISPQCI